MRKGMRLRKRESAITPRVAMGSACALCMQILLVAASAAAAPADSVRFDLVGPSIQAKVTRGKETLPIASVPNLQAGDKLWVRPDFPDDQSARYELIVVFLRGATNPSPDDWFAHAETWNKQVRQNGITVVVPSGAQQALLFLAPETGGGFGTLRATVRSRPGIFVRAAQALNQASLDHARLDKFLEAIGQVTDDPAALHERVALLTRTLAVKADPQCFEKPPDEQATCLTQGADNLVLEDAHSQSVVAALTSGPSADLVGVLSASPVAKGGYYSPYVGSAMDLVRLLNGLRTATLQYLPALALPKKEELNLRLNSPPSFQTPKSVLVVGLPAVTKATLPPLRPVDAQQTYCLLDSSLLLPAEGAPLVFSTDLAHDFTLRLQPKDGPPIDLPATADFARGGFAIDTKTIESRRVSLGAEITGMLRGSWGFEPYEGLSFHLENPGPGQWHVAAGDVNQLLAGRESTLHFQSVDSAACVQKIEALDPGGKPIDVKWKATQPGELQVQIFLQKEPAEVVKLLVQQFGTEKADEIALQAYSEAAHLDSFRIDAGDRQGVLSGSHLDEVKSVELNGVHSRR